MEWMGKKLESLFVCLFVCVYVRVRVFCFFARKKRGGVVVLLGGEEEKKQILEARIRNVVVVVLHPSFIALYLTYLTYPPNP
ncbi:hypothetical protein F4809DRAFT_593943 [Biscogniauxia mediterranea]|nr:hypothetical protein F4809DRAFT_593943 [Biscogniauxia mediterranea]